MGKRIGGNFNGTGQDVVICIGFVPDWVELWNMTNATPLMTKWHRGMRDVLAVEGVTLPAGGGATEDHAATEGICPYYGGETLTSTMSGTETYGEGNFLVRDDWDYRYLNANHSPGDAKGGDITKWTSDTPGSRTGKFDRDVTGTYIGEQSPIRINGRWYTIQVLTADQGIADDEVTLSADPLNHSGTAMTNNGPVSGDVTHIGGKFGYKPMVEGETTKDGFLVNYATLNVNDDQIAFEAGCWDM